MVLPKHENTKFVNITRGNQFGVVDIIGSILMNEDMQTDDWFMRKDKMKRQFTVMSGQYTEMLILTIQDVHRLQIEFTEYFDEIMKIEELVLKKLLKIKLDTMQLCQQNAETKNQCSLTKKVRCHELNNLIKRIDLEQPSEDDIDVSEIINESHDSFESEETQR